MQTATIEQIPATGSCISIQKITKRFRSVTALDALSLEIPHGSIYGLIGPNGAGKSTLLRILAALLTPTSGSVWYEGQDISRSPSFIQRHVGYMPDSFGVYPDLTVTEYLMFFAGIQGVSRRQRARIIDDLLELVDLTQQKDTAVEHLSRGMQQRLGLARALVHDPDLLVLDEPAAGLDPRSRIELRELLRALHEMGKTIIISSHVLLELAELCTDIAILQEGHLILSGDVHTVVSQVKQQLLTIHLLSQEQVTEAVAILEAQEMITHVTSDEKGEITATCTGDAQALHQILRTLIEQQIQVISFAPHASIGNRLEELFMSMTEGSNP